MFEDTRQKTGKHDNISDYMAANHIELIRQQLYVGDYTLITDQSVSIDTKQGLTELCTDLGSDKSRFMREVARAKKYGIKLIVLIEDEQITGIADIARWENPVLDKANRYYNARALTGKALQKRVIDVHINYGTEFLFCRREDTGRRIIELLNVQEGE